MPDTWQNESSTEVIKLVSITLGLVLTASSYPRSLGEALDHMVEADLRDKEAQGFTFQTVHLPEGIKIVVGEYARGMVGYMWMDETVVLLNFDSLDPLTEESKVLIGEILSSAERNLSH